MSVDDTTESTLELTPSDQPVALSPMVTPAGIAPGEVLAGKYRIGRRIGEGGMGVVYAAESIHLGREVAIKFLLDAASSKEGLVRFQQEAKACAKLAHEHIVQIFDLDMTEQGSPYIVMEKLAGHCLAGWLKSTGGLDSEHAARVGTEVLDALSAAHEAGIVHRDIKPANVFLCKTPKERAVVMDFGISRMDGADIRLTRTGNAVGTPPYMAPEQLRGEPASPASDVYSVGVTMFEALSGRLPYRAENVYQLQAQIITGERDALSETCPSLDPGLVDIIEHMLAPEPSERPTAEEARAAFLEWRAGRPVSRRPKRRNRSRMWAAAGVGVGLIGAAVALAVPSEEPGNERPQEPVPAAVNPPPKTVTAPPKKVTVELLAQPEAARWRVDGELLDCNPCDVTRSKGARASVEAVLPGHESETLEIDFDTPRTAQVRLKAVKKQQKKHLRKPPKRPKQNSPIVTKDPYAD